MKKNTKIIYISEFVLFIYLILFTLFINKLTYISKNLSAIIVLLLILLILLTFLGIKKDKSYLKGSSARIVTASLMTFMLIIYGIGIVLGFTRGYIYHNLSDFIRIIGPILIINIEIELARYIIAKNIFKSKKTLIIFTILSAILNILLEINIGTLSSSEDKFIFLSTMIFPVIAEEILCSYMTYKISLLPSIIYKLVIKLYIFVLPIVPNLGDYLYSIANIILPFIIYNILNKMVIKYEKEKQELKRANRKIFTFPLLIFLTIIILLVSGLFRYKLIAIASNSMAPVYKRGDAIVYEKVYVDNLEVGDILAFQKDNIIVTHRIVKIWKQGDDYYFTTKGDNNNTEDVFKPKSENVLGRVKFVFKYIGYPTILINEFFGKE